VDRRLLAAAYDRSAEGYDARFRDLQRVKFRAAAPLLQPVPEGALCLDAGGGTGLLLEWAREEAPQLAGGRWLVVDVSPGMLRVARARTPLLACADLSRLPVREARLVCAFTSVLDDVDAQLRELGRAVLPGGQLAVSFLAAEAPEPEAVESKAGLSLQARPIVAGQDRVFVLKRNAP
jgi:ubiquinone/menaquinone biosynthesis C-methylase UbiE